MMFVGYSEKHSAGTYRMFNKKTRRVSITRNARWLKRFSDTNEDGPKKDVWNMEVEVEVEDEVEEPTDTQERNEMNATTEVGENEPVRETEEEVDMTNPRVMRALRQLHTSYNPTLNEIVDLAMVGGTKEDHDNPLTFREAWDHPDEKERERWRQAIRKSSGI